MATVQNHNGTPLKPPILVVKGERRALKAEAAKGERLPFVIRVANPLRVRLEVTRNNATDTFAAFTLEGLEPGESSLTIQPAGTTDSYIAPIPVSVIARLELPDSATNAGVLVRLLLAEVPTPGDAADATVATETEAMTLIRVVLENRLAKPSGRSSSAGARSFADLARAFNQFDGFGTYPAIAKKQADNIVDKLRIANTASDRRHPLLRAHVERALAMASGARPADPTSTGLYWWRKAGSGPSGSNMSIYKTILGNTFYREGN